MSDNTRDIVIVLGLVALSATFALTGHTELAGPALGGILGYWQRGRAAAGAVAGAVIALALTLSGCQGATAATVRRDACAAATQVCRAVDAACIGSGSGGELAQEAPQ